MVRTKYSTINYKDALSHNGTGKIMRKFPMRRGHRHGGHGRVLGRSALEEGRQGASSHGYDLGVAHDGGYAEYVRVPADWIVRRPESMTAFDAMTLGTAGYTAALAIELMQHNGLAPGQRSGGGDRRDRRRGLGRGRGPRQARLRRGRDHRQGARRRIT